MPMWKKPMGHGVNRFFDSLSPRISGRKLIPWTLPTLIPGWPRQGRDRRLQPGETAIEGQERMPPEGEDGGLLARRQNRRLRLLGADRRPGPILPLRHGLRADAVVLRPNSRGLLTMRYGLTDLSSWCTRGAHGPGGIFQPCEETAPSTAALITEPGATISSSRPWMPPAREAAEADGWSPVAG